MRRLCSTCGVELTTSSATATECHRCEKWWAEYPPPAVETRDTSELVKVLRAIGPGLRNDGYPVVARRIREAATTLEQQSAEIERLREALSDILPTTLCGEGWKLPDNEHVAIDISFGKLRKARTALEPKEPGQ